MVLTMGADFDIIPDTMHNKKQESAGENLQRRRPKGSGSLVLRGDVWYARWGKGGIRRMESTGIRKGETRGGKSDRDLAEEWLADKLEPLRLRHREDSIALMIRQLQTVDERLGDSIEGVRRRMTVGEMAEAFRVSPRRPDCSEAMLEFYCGVLARFAANVGENMPVVDVGDGVAADYARKLGHDLAAGTYNKAINALTLAWKVLGREARLEYGDNPWADLARKRSDAHVRRAFSREETDAILEEATGEMRTLVAVCLYTGLRLGDACNFRWEDVRGDAAYVLTAKRDRKVGIPIHPKLREVLDGVKGKRQGFVMPGMAKRYNGASQGASNVSRSIKRLIERCGIKTSVKDGRDKRSRPDATAHSFRHTFVSRAIEAGVPPHVVQAIVGHASATMTEHYTHLSDEVVMSAFRKMG